MSRASASRPFTGAFLGAQSELEVTRRNLRTEAEGVPATGLAHLERSTDVAWHFALQLVGEGAPYTCSARSQVRHLLTPGADTKAPTTQWELHHASVLGEAPLRLPPLLRPPLVRVTK